MNTSALQHKVQIRPSRLAGLLVAVAVLAAATTWSASKLDESHNSATAAPQVSPSGAAAKAYVAGMIALTEEQRAAMYGNVTASDQHVKDIVALSPAERVAIYGNLPMSVGTP